MQFVDVVNRILRKDGVIRGDTDPLTNFNSLQHGATMNLAIIAVQDALNDFFADQSLPVERQQGTITLALNTRTYSLAAQFDKFWNDVANFYDATQNTLILEYAGGEQQLQLDIQDYKTQGGYPNWWYWVDASVATIGFYQVPDATVVGRVLTYDYFLNSMVQSYNDTMPFQQDKQVYAFTEMALMRFQAMKAGKEIADMKRQPAYVSAMTKTLNLINPKRQSRRYGCRYALTNPSTENNY